MLSAEGSALKKYQAFFVGRPGLLPMLRYDLTIMLASGLGGSLGYALRKKLFPGLFAQIGRGVNFGRNLSLRCPGRMRIGNDVAIDDGCLLDGRGASGPDDFCIGNGTLIASDTTLLAKQGYLRIGDNCSIGSQNFIGSISGIEIGDHAIIAGQCYFGGARYKTALGAGPMVKQGFETRGPVVLGDDVWVGAGVRVIDGVSIARGAIIGAGAVVTSNIPENAIAVGIPAKVVGERK